MSQEIEEMIVKGINRMKLVEQDCTEWLSRNKGEHNGFVISWDTSFLDTTFNGGNVMRQTKNATETKADNFASTSSLAQQMNDNTPDELNKFVVVAKRKAVKMEQEVARKFIADMTHALEQ